MTDAPVIVKVKPLVWEEAYDSHPWGWKARCAIMGGFYYADNDEEKQEQDALRASRVLAALDLTPDPRVTALVEAAGLVARLPISAEPADDVPLFGLDGHYITHGDVRAARAALAELKGQDDE
jgi:hypothetical protein